MPHEIKTAIGVPEKFRNKAAALYDEAFGNKFCLAVPNATNRFALLADCLNLANAIVAIRGGGGDDALVGLAGFETKHGALLNITYKKLLHHLGLWGSLRAMLVFALYDRTRQHGELLMDGIAVAAACRGQGIGTALFCALKQYASEHGYTTIRLDVIDTNPAAKRLYERLGFVVTKTQHFEYLRRFLGFGSATTMHHRLAAAD